MRPRDAVTREMILIVGASSYIGRHVAAGLGSLGVIGTHSRHPVAGSVYFDVTRMHLSDILPEELPITHALLCSANAKIDACKADVQRSYALNVVGMKAVIDEVVRRGVVPIFLSTEYVFDGERGDYTEEDAPSPTTVYGTQKLEVERYLAEHAPGTVVLRLAKVFGTDPDDGTILSGWLQQIQRGAEIRCARDQVFSPIHVSDVVAVIQAIIRQGLRGLFHVGNPEPRSRLGMLKVLLRYVEADARVIECSLKDLVFLDHRPLDLSLNPQKILGATGLTFRGLPSCCEEITRKAGLPRPRVMEVSQ